MLTQLKINGFKNLVDVCIRFGPFTCVAGANGIGKSNLFDAIAFLSALASKPLSEAAHSVRDDADRQKDLRGSDIRGLFHRVGNVSVQEMSFEVEMIVPSSAVDEYGQQATASITFLRYSLRLGLRKDVQAWNSLGALEILKEELTHITKAKTKSHLHFPHASDWLDEVVKGVRRAPAFISTSGNSDQRQVKLHQDGGSRGRPFSKLAHLLPRTMLSSANAAENPTVLCAKREMESWVRMQLEPSALRAQDSCDASPHLGIRGEHLPATLYRLAQTQRDSDGQSTRFYAQLSNRLRDLIEDVRGVSVDRDEKRELLTLQIQGKNGTIYPARALSDGTLRFLALAVLERDPEAQQVICLEEPENGIHPERIPAMLRLLQDIATDPQLPVDDTNPLRQVIVNTHSPAVVLQVPAESLIFAEAQEVIDPSGRYTTTRFGGLEGTWRTQPPAKEEPLAFGRLLAYINPIAMDAQVREFAQRVVDTQAVQMLLPFTQSGTK